jgi:signal transduction histidine kinase
VESFAERVGVLLAFAKLRADVTDTMEMRNATDLIVAVGDQASNMIHRINNTVGAMRLRIIELQEQQQTGEIEPDSFLAESLGALRNLADMTLQMPDDVTQVLSQQSSMVDVNDAVKQALARVRVPEKVTVDLGLGPDLPLLSLYCFDIVIQNLIQNAIDAMPDGGVMSVMTESAVQPDLPSGYIQVTVTDTGSGIPDGILPKIFELNFSTKGAKGKGLGLGLWWIRNFVRRANGNIAITSREGEGAQVVVRFPVDRSDSARDPGVQVSDFLT